LRGQFSGADATIHVGTVEEAISRRRFPVSIQIPIAIPPMRRTYGGDSGMRSLP